MHLFHVKISIIVQQFCAKVQNYINQNQNKKTIKNKVII